MSEKIDIHKIYPNEDKQTIYLFEIIGSFFTDIFFNHIYVNAKIKVPKESSLIDEYIKKLQLYLIGIKNNQDCYLSVMQNLVKYYNTVTKSKLDYNSFVSLIITKCIPPIFVEQFTTFNKQEIVSNIICDLVSNLATYIASPNIINHVVIEHTLYAEDTIRMLQDYSIHLLVVKKLNILNKFLKETGEVKEDTNDNILVIIELKKVIKQILTEKNEVIEQNNELKSEIEKMKKIELKLRKMINLLQSLINAQSKGIDIGIQQYLHEPAIEKHTDKPKVKHDKKVNVEVKQKAKQEVKHEEQQQEVKHEEQQKTKPEARQRVQRDVLQIVQQEVQPDDVHTEGVKIDVLPEVVIPEEVTKKVNPRTIVLEEDNDDDDDNEEENEDDDNDNDDDNEEEEK